MVWVRQSAPSGEVTLFKSGPRLFCKSDRLNHSLYNGEECWEVIKADGSIRSVWYEAVIND